VTDQNNFVAMNLYGANGLTYVEGKISRWSRRVAETRESERLGTMPMRDEQVSDFLESPTALPTSGYQDERRHFSGTYALLLQVSA
jgi:hypothetical protein